MKKLTYLLLLIFLSISLTACNGKQDQASFKEIASRYGFPAGYDHLERQNMTATKNGCRINFYEFDSTEEAKEKYERFLPEAEKIESQHPANQRTKINLFYYHHYSVKTASKLFYATQYGNTLLYFNGERHCENQMEKLIDALGY